MLGSAFEYVGDTLCCNWNVLLYIVIAAAASAMFIWNSIAPEWCSTAPLIGAGEPQQHAPQVTGALAAAAPQVTDAVAVSALQTAAAAAAAARVKRILLLPHFLNTCTCYWRWWRHVFFMYHEYMTTSSLSVPTFNIRLMYVLSLLYSEITSLLYYTVNIE